VLQKTRPVVYCGVADGFHQEEAETPDAYSVTDDGDGNGLNDARMRCPS